MDGLFSDLIKTISLQIVEIPGHSDSAFPALATLEERSFKDHK
jgi:hypothetical protein